MSVILLSLAFVLSIVEASVLFNNSIEYTGNNRIFSHDGAGFAFQTGKSGTLAAFYSSGIAVHSSQLDPTPVYRWGLPGTSPGRFNKFRDLAVSPNTGDIYVLDSVDFSNWGRSDCRDAYFRIQVFEPTGGKRKESLSFLHYPPPQVQPRRNKADNKEVIQTVNDKELIRENTIPLSPPVQPNELLSISVPVRIQVGIDGNIYLLDAPKRRIVVLTDQGESLFEIGHCSPTRNDHIFTCANEDKALCGPLEFTISSQGLLYVLDTRYCEPRGQYESLVKSGSRSGGYTYDSQGNLIKEDALVDYRIMIFDAVTGQFKVQRLFRRGYGPGEFRNRLGLIAVDAQSNLYISDTDNDRIQVFNTSLQFASEFGYPGHGNGQFDAPTQLSIQGNTLLVRDRWDPVRIQKFIIT